MLKKEQQGYSLKEVDSIMKKYIDASALRLKARLRVAWAKQQVATKKLSHENA